MSNKKHIIQTIVKRATLLVTLVVISGALPAQIVFASTNSEYYTEIDNQMFEPTDSNTSGACSTPGASTPTSTPVSGFSPDPKAVKMFESDIKPSLSRLIPLYQQAAKDENFAEWQIIPGIHYREHGMSTNNPGNGDGVFQTTFSKWNDPNDPTLYQPNKVLTDKEFIEQLRGAIRYYLAPYAKGMGIDVTKSMNADQAAKIAFAYNSGPAYTDHPYTASTYAWAGFNTTKYKLPMTGVTGHIFPYVDNRPGTATVWGLVRGGNISSASECNSGTAVTNNVVWYSQYDSRWANKPMGCGTIGSCGCYLTDL
ncbi:MAG TPA: hypothetical protein VNG90_02590, partial [Candidatus Acidoferrum sp.]|nr:hypothetical protein [Candidatus Acidoferrum sp.]